MREPESTPPAPSAAAATEADAAAPGLGRLRRGVELLALAWAAALALVFAARITYPLELEWMEGGSLHHALRLLRGEAIYAAPSIDFVPFLYTPLYPGLLALLASLGLPLGLALGRAVSVAAVAAIAAGLWRLVAAEGKPRAHRAAAVGLFLAGYVFAFRWYDVARADAVMYALLLWGALLIRRADGGWRRPLVAGLLVALAFWTKQTAAVLIVASGVGGLALGGLGGGRFLALLRYTLAVAVIVPAASPSAIASPTAGCGPTSTSLHQTHGFNHERFTRKTWGCSSTPRRRSPSSPRPSLRATSPALRAPASARPSRAPGAGRAPRASASGA
ncbi:MAG: glycosyltransferase 87 family protein [Nannocystaceae bacterium]